MATTVERTPEGILYKPSRTRQVPQVDLMTLLFDSDLCKAPGNQVIMADAEDPSRHLTKSTLLQQSKRCGHFLRSSFGIGSSGPNKDVVIMIASGHHMIPTLFYGTLIAEGIFSSTSPSATAEELAYQLTQTNAKVVVATADTKHVAIAAAAKVGLSERSVLVIGGDRELTFTEAATGAKVPFSNQELDWRRITDAEELANSTICLLFSSGTTGLPKAMRLSHQNIVAAAYLNLEPVKEYNIKHHGPDFEYVTLAHLPAAHIAGVQGYLVNITYMGGTCYWMQKFDFVKFLSHVQNYKVTTMFTVPPIYLLLAKMPIVKDQLATWVDAISGAAPMGDDLQVAAGKKLGGGKTKLRQTWGLSETTGSFTATPVELMETAPAGSVGALVDNCYIRMVDDDGNDVEPGQPGEIWCKGPVVTKGYWNNEKANKEAFKNDWFCTGDIGVFRDGFFFIVDRKKELIKYKGNQVAPAELEALLLSHPKILDAAVIGVPGEGTEVPRAYIVANPKEISEEEILEWFKKQGVARYKFLRGGVKFLEAIPKSPSGKILRKNLRDQAKKEFPASKL
ncbi:4-coumarate--CoA ligase [Microdochium nivale]|nr:4-coumarate--CoA ligase [Microdochium nivale]